MLSNKFSHRLAHILRIIMRARGWLSCGIKNSGETIPIQSYKNGQQHMIYYPSAWRVEQPELSYDVYENRLLKQFLRKQLVSKLTAIQERANGEIQRRKMVLSFRLKHKFDNVREEQEEIRSLERVIEDCQKMKQRC